MSLFDKHLVVVAGKGGVGRTTVGAALAVAAAKRGKRVLLCQTKSKERLSTLFGVPAVGTDLVRVPQLEEHGGRLYVVNMTPQAALREYGTLVLRSEFIAKQVLENRVTKAFLHAVPGLEDYSMLGKVWWHTTEEEHGRKRWDLVIMDGPATGHLLTLLTIPQSILEAVPEGPLTRPARATQELLRDPKRAALVLVTLAEDMPSNEAIELAKKQVQSVGMPFGPLVVNMLYPPRFLTGPSARVVDAFDEDLAAMAKSDPGAAPLIPLVSAARTAKRRRELNDRYLERLARDLPLPQVQLPYLFTPRFGPEALEELARRLDGQVMAAPANIPVPLIA
jgi:anion-transporting  ArsA/GET3 family ATPase